MGLPIATQRGFIRDKLEAAFPGASIEVKDTTGGDDHFDVTIKAEAFAGHTMIEQHRMVYAALGPRVGREIHALALTTGTP